MKYVVLVNEMTHTYQQCPAFASLHCLLDSLSLGPIGRKGHLALNTIRILKIQGSFSATLHPLRLIVALRLSHKSDNV